MPSVVITGASRGLGYAFVTYFASLPHTTVIGIARNTKATEARLKKDNVNNVTLLSADIADYKALQKAAEATSKITGGGIDLLINNAAYVSEASRWKTLVDFEPQVLEDDMNLSFQINVVGVAHTINAFLPLIRRGGWKKVITISTGMADNDLINDFSIPIASPYSVSKAAVNTLIAKYNAAFGKTDRILFMAISPGLVDTSEGRPPTEEDIEGGQAMGAAFASYAPHFTGPITPEESVRKVVEVINEASVETKGGVFVSHFGNKQWL